MSKESQLPPTPAKALERLEPLIGTWTINCNTENPGDIIHGRMNFAWIADEFFLAQEFNIKFMGMTSTVLR